MKKSFLKNAFCVLLAMVLLFSSLPISTSARHVVDSQNFGSLHWELYSDHVLEITGNGPMPNFTGRDDENAWRYDSTFKQIERVIIGEGITSVSEYAFYDCPYLESVSFPNSLESIGLRAFENCESLKEINFSEGLKTIGHAAFGGCIILKRVMLPEGLTTIGGNAFYECSDLEFISIPDSVEESGFGLSVFYETYNDSPILVVHGSKGSGAEKYFNSSSDGFYAFEEHDFGEWVTIKGSTCDKDGLKEGTCKVCGKVEPSDSKVRYLV